MCDNEMMQIGCNFVTKLIHAYVIVYVGGKVSRHDKEVFNDETEVL